MTKFPMKNTLLLAVELSNPTDSLVKCFIKIPFAVKARGVIIPKRTGIHAGMIPSVSSLIFVSVVS